MFVSSALKTVSRWVYQAAACEEEGSIQVQSQSCRRLRLWQGAKIHVCTGEPCRLLAWIELDLTCTGS
jgi:hypothetical protein